MALSICLTASSSTARPFGPTPQHPPTSRDRLLPTHGSWIRQFDHRQFDVAPSSFVLRERPPPSQLPQLLLLSQ